MNAFLGSWNQVAERLVAQAVPGFVQSAVLVLLLLAAERLLRHRLRPAFRHALWLLVPLKLLLPPSLAFPASPAYWLPRPAPLFADPALSRAEPSQPLPPAVIEHRAGPSPSTAPSLAAPVEATPRPGIHAVPAARLTFPGGLLLVWVIGVLGLLVWLTRRTVALHRLTTLATVAPPHLHAALDHARARLELRRRVGLRLVGDGHSPALCGLWKPVVLLPRTLASRLGPERLRAVLLHEIAHARRLDLWVNALQTLLQVVWWWHPLVWVANARLRAAREECVDDTVAYELGPDDESYPAALLEAARSTLARPVLSLGLVGIVESRSALRGRIERLLESPPAHPPRLGRRGILAVTVTGLLLLPMARGTPDPQPAAPPAAPQPVSSAAPQPVSSAAAPAPPFAENPEPSKARVLIQTRLLSIPGESLGALGLRLATNPPTAGAGGGVHLILEGTGTHRADPDQLPALLAAIAQRPEIETLSPPSDTPWVPGQWMHLTLLSNDTNHPFSLQLDFAPQPTTGSRKLTFAAVATSTEFVDLRKGAEASPANAGSDSSPGSAVFAVNAVGYVNRTRTNTVELRHGETVLLASPAIPETVHTVDKVAGLGDLPVLGRLFQTKATHTRTRWQVALVTATWMDGSR